MPSDLRVNLPLPSPARGVSGHRAGSDQASTGVVVREARDGWASAPASLVSVRWFVASGGDMLVDHRPRNERVLGKGMSNE